MDDEQELFGFGEDDEGTWMRLMVVGHQFASVTHTLKANVAVIEKALKKSSPQQAAPSNATPDTTTRATHETSVSPQFGTSGAHHEGACEDGAPNTSNGAPNNHTSNDESKPPRTEPTELQEVDSLAGMDGLRKRVFKHVALHCHPDKSSDERRHRIFLRARKYHDDGATSRLMFCAARLCLMGPVMPLTPADDELAQVVLAHMSRTVTEHKQSSILQWSQLSSEQREAALRRMRPSSS